MPDHQHSYEELIQRITKLEEQNKNLQSEAIKYRTFFDSFPHGITVSDSHGNIIESNLISEQLLGINKEEHKKREISGQEWRIIGKDGNDMPANEWASVIALKENHLVTGCEMGIIKPDSQTTWLNVTAAPIPLEGYGVAITYNDITEKKHAENALRESEKRYRKIFNNKHVAMLVIDPETGSIIDANPSATTLYGWSRPELTKMNIKEINTLPWDDLSSAMQKTKNEKNKLFNFEHRLKDGSIRDMEVTSAPIEFDGKTYLFSIIHDITERKKAEIALHENVSKYRMLFDNAVDAIFVADPDTGILVDVNKKAEELTGYLKSELIGKHQAFIHPEEDSEFYHQEFQNASECAGGFFREMLVQTKDGKHVPVEINSGGSVKIGDKRLHIGIFRNITERKVAEETLIKSEFLFRGLYDNMTSGSAIYEVINDGSKGSDFIVKSFNQKSLEIEGKTLDQVIRKSLFDLRPNIDDYGIIPVMKKVWETGEPAYFPIKIYQDEIFSNYYENYIFKIPTGEIVTIYNDVTDQKNAEEALRKSEERFALAMEFANDGLFDWNLETNEIYYSPVWKLMLGYENDELPNDFSIWETLTNPEDAERSWKMQNELINKQRDRFEIEFRMKHKDGHWVDILSRAKAIFDKDDTAIRIVGTHVDISERKTSEKELKKQRDLFELVINSVPARIFWKDLNLVYLGCNIHFAKDSGMKKPEDVIGKDDYNLVWKKNADEYRADDELVISTGKPKLNYEEGFLNREGKKVWWMTSKMPLRSSDGKIIGIIAISENITERKKTKKDKTILESKLQQAQKMESIGTLAGGIAHDFNNILSSIIGFSELALGDAEKGTDLEDDLQEIRNAGLRAKDLVKQILTFARQTDEEVKPIQVNVITFEVLKFIKSSIPSTIQINDKIESDSLIMGSPTQIHQVLMNLCTNAAYAMEENGGILEISVNDTMIDMMAMIPNLRPGDYIEIKVTDTGMGISPQHIHTIFEPYFTTKPVGEGTGMGLAVVHGIVESYGGKILVNSTIGQGTCFTIYLPITKKRKVHTHSAKKDLPLGTENILFVDDEAPIAKMGSKVLEQIGYSVTTRTSSVEALELFRSKPQAFDLVITDMTMPNMTGDKMAAKMMKIRSDIPVVLCTGYSKKISKESAADIGIKALVYKPVVKADLAKTVRKVLDEVNRTE